jgi:hypothetical protein
MIELTELKKIERSAVAVLTPLVTANSTMTIIALFQPHDEDYEKVFLGDAAARARAGYGELWASPPKSFGNRGQTEVQVFATQAESFLTDNAHSREFPGGYRKIADQLNPDLVWLRFKYVEPRKSAGMAYDGLVWFGGRWAWFPKPWRILGAPADN